MGDDDLELATSIVGPGERIIATFHPSVAAHWTMVQNQLACLAVVPCFWCHAAVLSPCCVTMCCLHAQTLEHTTYVLTDRKLHMHLGSEACTCCQLGNGLTPGSVDLSSVSYAQGRKMTAQDGAQCNSVCGTVYVIDVGVPPGHPIANAGGGKHRPNNKVSIPMNTEDEAVQLAKAIDDARNSASAMGAMAMAQPIAQPMMMGAPPMAQPQTVILETVTTTTTTPMPMAMERPGSEGIAAELLKLSELHTKGILSMEEFEAAKARVLSGQ